MAILAMPEHGRDARGTTPVARRVGHVACGAYSGVLLPTHFHCFSPAQMGLEST